MGGASSDAAAVLVALNEFWRLGWPAARLAELASELGSDVPFFLATGRSGALAATCRGRGERIQPETGLPRLHVVVAKPPAGLATAAVYRHGHVPANPRTDSDLRTALYRGDAAGVGRSLFNRLQETAERLSPWIVRLRDAFDQADVLGHQMSGSGTSYFGICRNGKQARQLAARLRGRSLGEVFYATTWPAW
jgi:4-diphosphocytidyl-2-C-methyl-D-erythritol kinase